MLMIAHKIRNVCGLGLEIVEKLLKKDEMTLNFSNVSPK